MFTRINEINQGMNQRTCELSGEGLWCLKVFLAATFLTDILVLVGTREAADPEVAWLLEADFGEIGWCCITTFFQRWRVFAEKDHRSWWEEFEGGAVIVCRFWTILLLNEGPKPG
jgi:hypothetical protein